jgi:hypothetical protein
LRLAEVAGKARDAVGDAQVAGAAIELAGLGNGELVHVMPAAARPVTPHESALAGPVGDGPELGLVEILDVGAGVQEHAAVGRVDRQVIGVVRAFLGIVDVQEGGVVVERHAAGQDLLGRDPLPVQMVIHTGGVEVEIGVDHAMRVLRLDLGLPRFRLLDGSVAVTVFPPEPGHLIGFLPILRRLAPGQAGPRADDAGRGLEVVPAPDPEEVAAHEA